MDGQLTIRVMPKAGNFLFFPPTLLHRVEVNRSDEQRLSIAFNLGPLEPD
jgi:ectoine hydroxylase-related dioxygenase (phytanoyl-CoA dioxygenase family)